MRGRERRWASKLIRQSGVPAKIFLHGVCVNSRCVAVTPPGPRHKRPVPGTRRGQAPAPTSQGVGCTVPAESNPAESNPPSSRERLVRPLSNSASPVRLLSQPAAAACQARGRTVLVHQQYELAPNENGHRIIAFLTGFPRAKGTGNIESCPANT